VQINSLADPRLLWVVLTVVYFVYIFGIALGVAYWIHRDATLRENGAASWWAIGTILLFPIVPTLYLLSLWWADPRAEMPTRTDRRVAALVLGAVAAVLGSSLVAPPDPFSNTLYTIGLSVVTFPLAYLYVFEFENVRAADVR